MRDRALRLAVLVLCAALPCAAQTRLELRWELIEDVFTSPYEKGASRSAFTLTNRGAKRLPASGWTLYWSGFRRPLAASVTDNASIESLPGDFQRLQPSAAFQGLDPGESARFEYVSGLIPNLAFAPAGPYMVFDDAPDRGHAIEDYVAVPFARPDQAGRDPRVVTPEQQFAENEATRDLPLDALPPVFPTPARVERREGRVGLRSLPAVSAPAALRSEAELATEYLRPYFPAPTADTPDAARAATPLRLETRAAPGRSPEAYELVVDPQTGIRIVGNSPAGVFYGLQSLRSMLPAFPETGGIELTAVRIQDAPRFAYRGLHLDVARNFQSKAAVLRVLDVMSRYKLNVLHFHLTDDEGWRVPIRGLPELTAVGGRRGHTLDSGEFLPPAYGSGPDVDRPYGSGFYSEAEYVEILRYAAARRIEVIPELEMPGHARAAIKSMEARARRLRQAGDAAGAARFLLSDPDDRSVYTSAQDFHDNVVNPALPSTYAFVERVVEDLAALHREAGVPLRNLHMGGDEVPAGVWQKSPAAQAYMKKHGLASTAAFWPLFYERVEAILKRRGIPLSGWEEIGMRPKLVRGKSRLVPNPAFAGRGWRTYVWNNAPGGGAEDLAYRLANDGYGVVLCPVTNLYFDLAYNRNPEERGLNWGGYIDVDAPFAFVPLDYYRSVLRDRRGNPLDRRLFRGKQRLTARGRRNVLGIQAQLWSEALNADGRLDYMLLPKLLGLAERAWAPDPAWATESDEATAAALYRDAWSEFASVVGKRELPRLAREDARLRYRIPTPGLRIVDGLLHANMQIPGFVLRYTTDGSDPSPASPELRAAIPARGRVRVAAFDATGRSGHAAELRTAE